MANTRRIDPYLHDTITLLNIDNEDFFFDYDGMPYDIKAGQQKRFPRFVAAHCLKHLIDHLLNKKNISLRNKVERDKLAAKIVVDVERIGATRELSFAKKTAALVEELNQKSDLDLVLDRRETVVSGEEELNPDFPQDKENLTAKEPEVKAKPKPTRKELYEYAEKVLKMTLDPKTKKKLNRMKIDELIKEFDYSDGI